MPDVKVGDQVLLLEKRGERPKVEKITGVTPSGWIKLGSRTFTPKSNTHFVDHKWKSYSGYLERATWKKAYLYLYSTEMMDILVKEALECEQAEANKIAERDQRRKEIDEQIAAELAQIKAVMGILWRWQLYSETLPDGSRLYLFNLPVPSEHAERKQFERVLIRCIDSKSEYCDPAEPVTAYQTSCTKRDSSFGSSSGTHCANDEDGIWEILRWNYHNSW